MNFSEISVQTIVSLPFEENAYLVYRNGRSDCFLVDPGTEPHKMLQCIENKKLNLEAILITHGHYDHIGGIYGVRDVWGECKIYIGEKEKEKLIDPNQNLSDKFGIGMTAPEADILLQDGDRIEIGGIPIEVRHVPGHSKGHVVYLIHAEPKSLLFSGDVLFRQSIGRSDFFDGNHDELIRSITEKVLTLPDETIVYPGHGEPTTIGDEKRFNPFL